jgi:hypothetical protein
MRHICIVMLTWGFKMFTWIPDVRFHFRKQSWMRHFSLLCGSTRNLLLSCGWRRRTWLLHHMVSDTFCLTPGWQLPFYQVHRVATPTTVSINVGDPGIPFSTVASRCLDEHKMGRIFCILNTIFYKQTSEAVLTAKAKCQSPPPLHLYLSILVTPAQVQSAVHTGPTRYMGVPRQVIDLAPLQTDILLTFSA